MMRRKRRSYFSRRRRRNYLLFYKRMLWVFLIPLSLGLNYLTEKNPGITERIFSGGIYKYYAIGLGFLTEKLPFSLMEMGIILAVPVFLILIVLWVRHLFYEWDRIGEVLQKSFWNVAAAGSILFFWLTLMCNVNYNRYTFAEISGLTIQPSSTEELYQLCLTLAEEAVQLREQLVLEGLEDEEGVFTLKEDSIRELSKTAAAGYRKLGEQYQQFAYPTIRTKSIFFSHQMSYTNLVGVYCPFTMEANINQESADYSVPSTICHELAHYYGFMREDEANFIGYLVCKNAGNLEYEYSGTMLALIHAGNQLAAVDMERYTELWLHYSDGIIADLRKNSEYWEEFKDNKVMEVSQTVNDSYLKANHQTDGIQSYGRMVDLLLAYYREGREAE